MAVDTFTTSDGIKLAYYIDDFTDPWRQADTLLLLHAAVGHAQRFYAWVPPLCRHYRVVRLDLRGHGASAGAAGVLDARHGSPGRRRRGAARTISASRRAISSATRPAATSPRTSR